MTQQKLHLSGCWQIRIRRSFFFREHTRLVFTKVNSKDDLLQWILINHVTAKKAMTIPPQESRPPRGIPGGGRGGVQPPPNIPRTTSHYQQNINRHGPPKLRQRPKSDEQHKPPLPPHPTHDTSRQLPIPPQKSCSASPREVSFQVEHNLQVVETLELLVVIYLSYEKSKKNNF